MRTVQNLADYARKNEVELGFGNNSEGLRRLVATILATDDRVVEEVFGEYADAARYARDMLAGCMFLGPCSYAMFGHDMGHVPSNVIDRAVARFSDQRKGTLLVGVSFFVFISHKTVRYKGDDSNEIFR